MFSKILVPVDFNDLATLPATIALELARTGHGKVVLLSVVDDSFPNPDIFSFQLPWADYYRQLREVAQQHLEDLKRKLGGGEDIEVCVVHGSPAKRIANFAEEEHCDLTVMATHGVKGLQHALMGSVTRRVLHMAHCPVMVVRQPKSES